MYSFIYNIKKVKSNSMLGFMTRIRIKVLACNISFFISKAMNKDESIAKIKELIFG
ncbi:TPA: hypothetical protein ACRRXJ_000790 [Clostridioides difficile]